MPSYRIKKKGVIITVQADTPSQARYKADQAYDFWHHTGRKPSGAVIEPTQSSIDARKERIGL